jgi:hypothetical protein
MNTRQQKLFRSAARAARLGFSCPARIQRPRRLRRDFAYYIESPASMASRAGGPGRAKHGASGLSRLLSESDFALCRGVAERVLSELRRVRRYRCRKRVPSTRYKQTY